MPAGSNDCIPYLEPGTRPTGRVTPVGGVRGKRFVEVSADIPGGPAGTENIRVAEVNASGDPAVAVSCYDGVQNEEIPLIRGSAIVPVTSGAAITAGVAVQSDAQGRAIPLAGGVKLGVAVSTVAGADLDVAVALCL